MKAGNGSHYIWKYLDSFSKALAPARKQYRIGPLFTQERRFRSDLWQGEVAPLFGGVLTGTAAEEPTEREVNIQEWGLGLSAPNPLGQPPLHDVDRFSMCVNDLFLFRAFAVQNIPDSFSCRHEKLSGII